MSSHFSAFAVKRMFLVFRPDRQVVRGCGFPAMPPSAAIVPFVAIRDQAGFCVIHRTIRCPTMRSRNRSRHRLPSRLHWIQHGSWFCVKSATHRASRRSRQDWKPRTRTCFLWSSRRTSGRCDVHHIVEIVFNQGTCHAITVGPSHVPSHKA